MPHKVLMPALSPTMTEGKLAKWVKKEGDEVKAGDVIAEIETDKATMEVEAVDEGTLAKIYVDEGTDGVAVNSLIAVLLEEDEDESALENVSNENTAPEPEQKQEKSPEAKTEEKSEKSEKAETSAPAGQKTASPDKLSGKRIFVSPLARRMAKERGIDLASVKGSGPRGRIVKSDIENFSPSAAASGAQRAAPASGGVDAKALADAYNIPYQLVPNSNVRKIIARRLTESKQLVPHYYLTIHCNLDELLRVRKEINHAAEGYKLSVNDFIVKAAAMALVKVPEANVSWMDDATLQYERADVSVAVATEGGLVTPIVKNCAEKSLKEVSGEVRDLAGRARDGKLKPEEFQGGTISVSNLGMYGVSEFSAIINPPQACILAIGAGEQRAIVVDGAVKTATMVTVTASFDHRAIDGAVGAQYLAAFKELIEKPMGLLL